MFEFARALAYATCNLEDIRSVVAAGQVLILAIAAQTKPEPRLTGVLLRDKLHEAPFCREKDGTVHVVARVAEATTAIGVNILSVFGEERQDHYELRLFVFLASDGVEKELRDRLEAVCGLLRRIRGSVTHV